jgi:tRNA(fMet)-specific endonuclease VapC
LTPRYLLDTDTFIQIRRARNPKVITRFQELEPGEAAISVISFGELVYGARKSAQPEQTLETLRELLVLIPVRLLPQRAGELYGTARNILERAGLMIGSNDLWIATHAQAENLTVVTGNEREFRRVPHLKVENWAR